MIRHVAITVSMFFAIGSFAWTWASQPAANRAEINAL